MESLIVKCRIIEKQAGLVEQKCMLLVASFDEIYAQLYEGLSPAKICMDFFFSFLK